MDTRMSQPAVTSPTEPVFSHERVAIFWDYENCPPPANVPGYVVADNIRRVAHNFGSVTVFKAYLELSENASQKTIKLRSELQSSGVSLTDCPHNGRKDVSDKMIIVDLLAFAIDNPSPATIILISGDRDFVYAISVLRHRRYRVVLVVPKSGAHVTLKSQASTVLEWQYDILQMQDPRLNAAASTSASLPNSDSSHGTAFFTAPDSSPDEEEEENDALLDLSPQSSTLRDTPTPFVAHSPDGSVSVITPPSASGQSNLGEPKSFTNYRLTGMHSSEHVLPGTPSTLGYASPPNPPTSSPVLSPPSTYRGLRTHVSSLSTSSEPPIGSPFNRARSQSLAIDPIRSIWRTTSSDTPRESESLINHHHHNIGHIATPSSLLYTMSASGSGMQSPWVFPLSSTANPFRPTERPTSTTKSSALPPRAALPTPIYPSTSPSLPTIPSAPPGHIFDTLIDLLERWRLQGNSQPLRSLVGAELPKRNPVLYQRAGVSTFGEYVRLAEREGVIRLGAGNYPGSEWITLESKYISNGKLYVNE